MESSTMAMACRGVALVPSPPTPSRPFLKGSGVLAFRSCHCAFFRNGREHLSRGKLVIQREEQRGFAVKALFGLGVPELAVIAGVTALIFGPKQIPEIGRSIGKAVKSFQQAAKEFETELKKENEPPTTELAKPESSVVSAEANEKNVQI